MTCIDASNPSASGCAVRERCTSRRFWTCTLTALVCVWPSMLIAQTSEEPSPRPDVVQAYREAVHGLLNGAYRIREHYRGGRTFRAELQKPHEDEWQTIGTWYGWAWPFPRGTHVRVLQNVVNARSGKG